MFTLYSYVLKPNKCNSLLFITFLKSPDSVTHPVFQTVLISTATTATSFTAWIHVTVMSHIKSKHVRRREMF